MVMMNSWACLTRGHAFRAVTHEGSAYQYCLRCGKIAPGRRSSPSSRDEEHRGDVVGRSTADDERA